MGNRTLVLLHNDQTGEWSRNPELGQMIARAAPFAMGARNRTLETDLGGFGRVVECAHADTQTLAVVDSYCFEPIAYSHWSRGESEHDRNLRLLKNAADKLGYRLVAKRK